jgi:hypothetical protein
MCVNTEAGFLLRLFGISTPNEGSVYYAFSPFRSGGCTPSAMRSDSNAATVCRYGADASIPLDRTCTPSEAIHCIRLPRKPATFRSGTLRSSNADLRPKRGKLVPPALFRSYWLRSLDSCPLRDCLLLLPFCSPWPVFSLRLTSSFLPALGGYWLLAAGR